MNIKNNKQIVEEIESQIKALKKKKVKPELLLLGSMAYYTLKVNNADKLIHTANTGQHLVEFMGLKIVHKPVHEAGGIFKSEHDSVEVFGR